MVIDVNLEVTTWVSCHKCGAQTDVLKTRIVMAKADGSLVSAEQERIARTHGRRSAQWVRLCPTCNKEERG